MATFTLIAFILAVTAAEVFASTEDTPCTSGKCATFNLFLGPKWGSKTIKLPLPNNPSHKMSSEEEEKKSMDMDLVPEPKVEFSSEEEQHIVPTYERPLFPKHRPVPEDGTLSVDFIDVEQPAFKFGQEKPIASAEASNWISISDVNVMFESGFLNLSGFGLTGEQVKEALHNLSSDARTKLQRLSLSHNQIQSLPKLTFPVELEYSLQELYLNDNPIGRLNSHSSFELSRLSSLKILSLARTGLHYVESLYIPSLRSLDFSGNALHNYYYAMFEGLINLQELDVSNNNLVDVGGLSANSFSNLKVLNLSNNRITNVNGLSTYKMSNLRTLYLNNNSLKHSYEIEGISYTVTLYLAGNPWECSCPLVNVVHGWLQVADKESMSCTDINIKTPLPVTSLSEQDVTIDCPDRGFKGWTKKVQRRFNGVTRWCYDHLRFLSPILNVLWWALMIGALVALVQAVRRHRQETAPSTIPYNILDNKHPI